MTLIAVNKVSKWIMVLSLIPVFLGVFFIIRTHFAHLHAVAVTGTITELIEYRNNDGKTYYHPVFLFKDTKGGTHKTCSSRLFSPNEAIIGDKCDFLYDPEDFSTVEDLKFLGIILIGLGLLDFFFFLIVMLVTKKMLNTASKNNVPLDSITIIQNSAKNWNRLSKLMTVLSCVSIIFCIVYAIYTIIFLRDAVPATGSIVEIERKNNDNKGIDYTPIFVFQDSKGAMHKVRSPTEATWSPQIGDKREILYNPKNPDQIKENSFLDLWGETVNGFITSFICFSIAIISKRKMNSVAKAQQQ